MALVRTNLVQRQSRSLITILVVFPYNILTVIILLSSIHIHTHTLSLSWFSHSLSPFPLHLVLILIVFSLSLLTSTNPLSLKYTTPNSLNRICLLILHCSNINLLIDSFSSVKLAIVSTEEYQSVFSKFQCLKEKFVALEQENHRLLGDLQQIILE